MPNINVVTPEGDTVSIPEDALQSALGAGYRRESTGEEILRTKHEAELEPYEGAGGAVKAGVQGVLRGATLGGSDWLQRLGGDSAQSLRLAKEAHPNISLGAEILGGVAPSLLTGGTGELGVAARLTPTGALSRGSQILAEGIGEGSALRTVGGQALSGAVEGGIQNVGSYLSDVALDNKPLSAEGFVGSLGQGALFGGAAAGGLAGVEQGTIAARRMFPKLAGGGKEAATVAEETFHAKANDMLKASDDLEKAGRDHLGELKIRNAELNLEKLKLKGQTDPTSAIRRGEIAVEQAKISAQRKAIRDAKNAERAAQGLPDVPPEAPVVGTAPEPAPDVSAPPANDIAPLEPVNQNAPTDLESQLLGTKQALDQGTPFTEIGKAENTLKVGADNAAHEAHLLADDAIQGGIDSEQRLAQKVEAARMTREEMRAYVEGLRTKGNAGRDITYRPLQAADEGLGLSASKRSGKVVTPVEGREVEAFASDQVLAGVGDPAHRVAIAEIPTVDVPLPAPPELDGPWATEKGRDRRIRESLYQIPGNREEWSKYIAKPADELETAAAEGLSVSPARFDEMRREFAAKLDQDELDAALYYSKHGYDVMNTGLRHGFAAGDPRIAEKVAQLKRAISKNPLPEETFVARSLSNKWGQDFAESMKVGDTFVEPAFTSTSVVPRNNAKIEMRIKLPAGTEAAPLPSLNRSEQELLLPPNTRFRVVSKSIDDGKTRLELEVIGPGGPTPSKVSGAELDAAYESAIEEAAKAATDDAQQAAIKRAGQLEDQILDHVAARGGRDADQVAAIRKAREEIGWTSEQVAARRAEKRAMAEMEGPTPARKVSTDDAAWDDALRASSEAMGSTQGERARALMGDLPRPRGASVADEILAGGRTVDLRPMLERPSQGRLVDSAERGIKVIGDFEKAHADLAQELGAAAPPAAAAHAADYTAAVDDQARKLTEKVAMDADRASSMVSLGDAPKVSRLPKLPSMPEGLAKRALDAAGALELLNMAGDLPFMPDPKDIPVIGPMLAMYLKFRGAKAVFNRFGGRVAASTDAKVAVRAAEMRDKVAGIADALLEGAGKVAGAAKRPAVIAGPKLLESLNHSQYDDGEERGKPKNAAEATRHRVAELAAAAANPEAVRAAIRQQVPASNPDVVAAVEDVALRKLQYLQSKAPKQPPPGPFRTREWVPSKVEMERFARRVRAADDPSTVIEDLQHGTVTPEAAETLREVYPQIFTEVQTRLITRAADLNVTLPHAKLVHLSLLFDAPLTPSLEPGNLAVLQQAFKSSPAQAPGQSTPPSPSVARPVNVSRLYQDDRRSR